MAPRARKERLETRNRAALATLTALASLSVFAARPAAAKTAVFTLDNVIFEQYSPGSPDYADA